MMVEQVDREGYSFSYLKNLKFGGVVSKSCIPSKDPLECEIGTKRGEVKVELEFQGHYGEPNLTLSVNVPPAGGGEK